MRAAVARVRPVPRAAVLPCPPDLPVFAVFAAPVARGVFALAEALGAFSAPRGFRAVVLSTVTCVSLRLSGHPGSAGYQCGSARFLRPHGVGAGTRRPRT
ncbi:hypothetical protein GCM10023082_37480 [Streptomyces tremellae]|uniref:Uncharacterized protein n=1 Tax=Streptomyces tremellae TaxID=1124239 RepID=A0ABP7FE71_9ACTN